jgi:hypothetical protein
VKPPAGQLGEPGRGVPDTWVGWKTNSGAGRQASKARGRACTAWTIGAVAPDLVILKRSD